MKSAKTALSAALSQARWAQALSPEEMERVQADALERTVATGGYVCKRGDSPSCWIGVIDGLLKMSSVTKEGKSITFTGMLTGGWFGEGSILKDEQLRYDAVALRNTHIALIPRATFRWLLDSNIAFNHFLLNQLNARLGMFISLVEYDRALNADARVARCIASLFEPLLHAEDKVQLDISQEELGYLCSTSRQRTNQALHVLERVGLIKSDYGRITICDLQRLRSF